jgi:hypothetical protein
MYLSTHGNKVSRYKISYEMYKFHTVQFKSKSYGENFYCS